MLSRLLSLLFLATLGWLLGRLLNVSRQPRPGAGKPRSHPTEPMVRDRVCNTFLPRSRAIVVRNDDREHFFCSERCRRQFLASGESVGQPAGSGPA